MVAGTKRGVLLFGLHTVAVYALTALFTALFAEYYVHECLLVVGAASGKAKGHHDGEAARAHLSRWGLSFLVLSQAVCAVLSALLRGGLLTSLPLVPPVLTAFTGPRWLSNEHCLVLVFALSWGLLRLPVFPSAVSFTVALASVGALASRCIAFLSRAAREMTLQRPRAGEMVGWVGQLAVVVGVAPVVFVAALLYDGSMPRSGRLGSFYGFLMCLSVAVCVLFSVLQCLRRRVHAEEGGLLLRDEVEAPSSPRSAHPSAFAVESTEFRAFAGQTCQRRSMKALLAVRAMHVYAYTLTLYFTHFMLTLGAGQLLSSGVRAALLAAVFAAAAGLRSPCAALAALLGKKRSLSLAMAAVAGAGGTALLLAFLTRDTQAVMATGTTNKTTTSEPLGAHSAAATTSNVGAVWCTILVLVQRLLLEVAGELLDLAQEDVVEEDAILFGRATYMAAWTQRLTSVPALSMQSLSCVVSLLFLAVTGALQVTVPQPPTVGPVRPTLPHALTTGPPSSAASARMVIASGSSVLALLGLQTCGVAVAMLVVWQRFYNLEGKHLQFVQMATRKRKDEQALSLV